MIGSSLRHTVGVKSIAAALLVAGALAAGLPVAAAQDHDTGDTVEMSDAAYEAQAIARGQALVEEHCARCHAIGLKDQSPHAEAPPFREVVELYPSENLAEALAEGIQSGHPDMPVFVFEPPQIEAFLAYLNSLAPEPGR